MYAGIRHDMLHYISRGGHGANISVTRSPFFTTVLEMQENFKRYDAMDPTHKLNNARLSQFVSTIFSLF